MIEEELKAEMISYLSTSEATTLPELNTAFSDYDAQEISAAVQHLINLEQVETTHKDGTIAYKLISEETQQKITIEHVNIHIEEIKSKLKGVEIIDFDLKIAALKKIGEIMVDDIQQLLHDICDDLNAAHN